MPVYQAPGVYVEEKPSGIMPIAGVGTSIAGFIGRVADNVVMPEKPTRQPTELPERYPLAPVNQPQLITSWERFKTAFGDFHEGNGTLAHAVYGFFNNGGTRCWITRVADEIDVENVRAALDTFKPIDEIAIVAVPGAVSDEVQEAVLSHCEDQYLQDRFAILDGRYEEVTNFNLTKEAIQGGTRDSDYGAIYFPRIQVYDPITKENIYVSPSGHIAGVYARVDTERGVHKAPANEVIRGALELEVNVTKADQAGLNPEGINVIRKFNGNNNILIWGARTLASGEDPEWTYINVRRLFLFLRESIDEGTQWAVFEPNDYILWAKIRLNVSAFLTNVWRDGALFGNKPQEAFYVKCDEETNPPEVRDLGQVIAEIGVAVVKPAEFVIFRISQWAGPKGPQANQTTTQANQ
ncbi:phage tail sheath family protein [Dendronalium sp. ChiSLP03b]|uniref:phage tail sheath family protein n=1 Tax=Dendronalium sp. ChiSLP03b TaxID=3075381 RepID=UPI002AD4A359|nr:phage tail sheath subtilisin-like domain-containing protein [Dendronalium sp. ChiSLP03b]MDZ8208926.1 phage tail sheath subtilisin-like domain-containing protein [Dendronalium sp. ChiSLP03b]